MDFRRFEYSRVQMGGQARVALYAPSEAQAERAARVALDEIERLENILSDWRPRSELSKLSASAGGPAVRVSQDLWQVLVMAQKIAQLSQGSFDITVGPFTKLWRESRKSERLPDRAVLREARERVGWEKLVLDSHKRTAKLLVPGMVLDAGGIAKGYALDRAIAVLKEHGIRSGLLEMGGDLHVSGPPPGQKGWRVEANGKVLMLANCAFSTSGTGEQLVQIGKRRYAHIVDPNTGLGLTRTAQVSIQSPEGLIADPLATTLCILGPGEATQKLVATFYRTQATFWYAAPSGSRA